MSPCKLCENYPEINRYTETELKLIKAIEALEFYANCRHFVVENVRGKIIEYDIDAGPLYEHYEEFRPTEERGRYARTALDEIRG